MAKLKLDGLLSELGLGAGAAPAAGAGGAGAPDAPQRVVPETWVSSDVVPEPARDADAPGLIDLNIDFDPEPAAAHEPGPSAGEAGENGPQAADGATAAEPDAGAPDAAGGLSAVFSADGLEEGPPPADLRTLLLEGEIVTPKALHAAETIVRQSPGARLTDQLLDQGADEAALFGAVARSLGLPFVNLESTKAGFDDKLVHRLTPEFCKQNQVLPVDGSGGRVTLATPRPDDVFLIDEVKRRLGARSVRVVVVSPSDLKKVMAPLEAVEEENVNVDEILGDIEEDDVRVEASASPETDLEREAGESPVIRYVNYIIQTASKEGASDIHIEPGDKHLKVRFRIDGELFEMMQPPHKMAAAITSRLKIMGNLDISERRLPQDGRIRCTVSGRKLDLRMSTLPNTYGEKVVLRILDTRSINVDLGQLGFDENVLTVWQNQIEQPHGIVLVTGPTGSGKTTTLYASLRAMDKKSQNISTVEDPVEYHLDGVTQTQTHEKIGMTFARALKALLRQDPDVILLGEIRDQETAQTAVQAALTGHLVLSTLHTNDAPSSITRLVNIGLEPFLLAAAVNAALAQRLVRRICQHCKRQAKFTDEMKEFIESQGMDPSTLFEGEGCDRCRNTGHTGRLGIYELLVIDDQLRDVVARNPNVSEFRRLCCERGMVSLRQDGFAKAARGQTTVQEIIRATSAAA